MTAVIEYGPEKQRPLPVGYKKKLFLHSTCFSGQPLHPLSAVYVLNLFTIYAHTSIGKAYSKGNGNFKLVLLFPHTLLHFSLSPSCTAVQSPTRTSELLNTRKWEIALKWKCWEMNLPCQTASVLFLQVSPFFSTPEPWLVCRSAV